jgi:hypothetical protein
MSNPMQALHDLGLNPFAVTLLAESMLKSAYVQRLGTKPLTFEFPVRRNDCADWAGVRLTIEAIPVAQVAAPAPQPTQPPQAEVPREALAEEVKQLAGEYASVTLMTNIDGDRGERGAARRALHAAIDRLASHPNPPLRQEACEHPIPKSYVVCPRHQGETFSFTATAMTACPVCPGCERESKQ